jgi:hypothetical protein
MFLSEILKLFLPLRDIFPLKKMILINIPTKNATPTNIVNPIKLPILTGGFG